MRSQSERRDGVDEVRMWVGAQNLFMELLRLLQGSLIITPNEDSARHDMSLFAEVFQGH